MDPKEIQEKYEALAAERDELQTKLDSALEQLKESAEANQELSDERDELTEKLAEVSSERDSAVSERDAVTVERDELKAKADAAELEVAKNVVSSFVGVKATKAEEGVLLEDYQRLGRDEFERRMGLRADLPHTQQVTKPETDQENSASKGGNAGARLVNKAKAEAEKATRS